MSNKVIIKKQPILFNSIDEQRLSYANQLTVKSWNDIINILRVQTNTNTAYIKQLHNWLVGNTGEDITIPENDTSFVEYVLSGKQSLERLDVKKLYVNGKKVAIEDNIPTKTSQLTNNSGFITNAVNNLTNYYLKSETYTKSEVQQLLSTISGLQLEVVTNLPTTNISSNTIYLKPLNSAKGNNIYEEYIYVNSKWETIGTTAVDLSNYALKADIPTKTSQLTNDSNFLTKHQDISGKADKTELKNYLPLSGAKAMTGNLKMKGNNIIFDNGKEETIEIGEENNEYSMSIRMEDSDYYKGRYCASGFSIGNESINATLDISESRFEMTLKGEGSSSITFDGFYASKEGTNTTYEDGKVTRYLDNYSKYVEIELPNKSGTIATIDDIPTKTSQLTNDSNYATTNQLFSKNYNDLTNKPSIPTKVSQLTNNSGFITNAVNNLTNYYLKSETYTKSEVQQLLSTISGLQLEVVTNLPTTNISSNTIYLKPLNSAKGNNIYEEYIYVNSKWETIGTTAVDLSNYALKADIPTKTSQLTNDSNFLTKHQDISGKADKTELKNYLPLSGAKAMTGNLKMKGNNIIFDNDNEEILKIGEDDDGYGFAIHMQDSDYYKSKYTASGFLIGNDVINANLDISESKFEITLDDEQAGFTPSGFSARKEGTSTSYEDGKVTRYLDNYSKYVEIELPNKSGELALNEDIPTKTSQLVNDSNYTTKENTGATLDVSIDNTTYVMTFKLRNSYGSVISTGTVDLPLETMVISARYADGKLYLTTKDGNELDGIDISNIVSGLVPNTRTVNGKALSSNIVLNKSDVGLGNVNNVAITSSQVSQITTNKNNIARLEARINALESAPRSSGANYNDYY